MLFDEVAVEVAVLSNSVGLAYFESVCYLLKFFFHAANCLLTECKFLTCVFKFHIVEIKPVKETETWNQHRMDRERSKIFRGQGQKYVLHPPTLRSYFFVLVVV
jgi:hypothetical protein